MQLKNEITGYLYTYKLILFLFSSYCISRRQIYNKLNKNHERKPGGQPVFSEAEEKRIVQYLIMLSCYGFPLYEIDVRHAAKNYLDYTNRKVAAFKNNMPGKEWAKSFLKRNEELSKRRAKNITVARSSINNEVIDRFFAHLNEELDGIPSENIYNYDETNVQDDPGKISFYF